MTEHRAVWITGLPSRLKPPAGRPPRQSPLVLPVAPPDPRRVDAADRWDALRAAHADPDLTPFACAALFAMWDLADQYGVYHGSASALATRLRTVESRGRAFVRLLVSRSYVVRRPDGSYHLQNPSVKGVSGARGAAAHGEPETGARGAGNRRTGSRTPPPYGGGGGRAPSPKAGAPPIPRRPREPKRVQCDRCDSIGWLQLAGPTGLSRCPDCNPGPPVGGA
jgi:hypothetical protein